MSIANSAWLHQPESEGIANIAFFKKAVMFDKMVVQQSEFSIAQSPTADHAPLISSLASDEAIKLVIDQDEKPEFLHHLGKMNVTAAALFPGLEGIARTVRDTIEFDLKFERFGQIA